MNARDRWARLAATIADGAGLVVKVDRRTYPGGVSHTVTHRLPTGDLIGIGDRWWRKNHDVWIGYEVWVEGCDGITKRSWPLTKKRSEVADYVREALALVAA